YQECANQHSRILVLRISGPSKENRGCRRAIAALALLLATAHNIMLTSRPWRLQAEIGCCYENRTELDCSPPSHFGRIVGTALERRCVNRESAILIEAKTSGGKRRQPCRPPRGLPGTFTTWSRPHRGPSAIWSAETSW